MRRGLLLALALACGCGSLYHVGDDDGDGGGGGGDDGVGDGVPIYITTADLDGDGLVGSADLCPTIGSADAQSQLDDDGDGVGNTCDPHPATPGDYIVLADALGSDYLERWHSRGPWMVANGCGGAPRKPGLCTNVRDGDGNTTGELAAWILFAQHVPATRVEVQVGEDTTDPDELPAIYIGAQLGSAGSDLAGRACGETWTDGQNSDAAAIGDLAAGSATIVEATANDLAFDNGSTHVIRWTPLDRCDVVAGTTTITVPSPGPGDDVPSGATVGVRFSLVYASIESVVVYARTSGD